MKNLIISIGTVILALSLLSLQGVMSQTLMKKISLNEAAKDCSILIEQKKELDNGNATKIAEEVLKKKNIVFSDVKSENIIEGRYISYKVEICSGEVYGKYVLKKIKKENGEGDL